MSRVYPPRPGQPTLPGGFGIVPSSESVDDSDVEVSDPDDSELSESSSDSEVVAPLGLGGEELRVRDAIQTCRR